MGSKYSPYRNVSNNKLIATVHLGDTFAILLMVVALFSYGTAWNNLSGAQITMLRLTATILSLAIVIFKDGIHKISLFHVLVASYALIIVIQGIFSPAGQGAAVQQGLLGLLVFSAPDYFIRKYGFRQLTNFLFATIMLSVVLMDIVALTTDGHGYLVVENSYTFSSNYILGNKFTLAYFHMLLLALYACRTTSVCKITLMALLALIMCFIAACSTGVIGIGIMLVVIIWCLHKGRAFSGWLVLAIIAAMALIAIAGTWIMTLPVVQSFTVDILGETPDFSGRLPIYSHLMDWFLVHPFMGYGSSLAANSVVFLNNGATDCQQGLFQILLSNGLIGGFIFLALCAFSLRKVKESGIKASGMYAFLISMAFISLVEINLDPLFLLGVSLVKGAIWRDEGSVQESKA